MRFARWISTVDTHTEGQATRIIIGGLGSLAGDNMVAKLEYFQDNLDRIRTLLIAEPRGHKDMYGCVLTSPTDPEADYGLFFMDNAGYMNMCGHGTVGVSTALVELGMVSVEEPESRIVLETPGGLVTVRVSVECGRVRNVCFRNVPAYVEYLGARLLVEGLGELEVDVAYGGNYFVFFRAEDAGLDVTAKNVKQIIDTSMRVMEAANRWLPVRHPALGNSRSINIATVIAPPTNGTATYRNVHVFGPRQFDRSPGGTGTSARLAVLHQKGEIGIDEEILVESLTGGIFRGRIVGRTRQADKEAFVTEVTGSAYVTGFHQFVVDPEDRLKEGFLFQEI